MNSNFNPLAFGLGCVLMFVVFFFGFGAGSSSHLPSVKEENELHRKLVAAYGELHLDYIRVDKMKILLKGFDGTVRRDENGFNTQFVTLVHSGHHTMDLKAGELYRSENFGVKHDYLLVHDGTTMLMLDIHPSGHRWYQYTRSFLLPKDNDGALAWTFMNFSENKNGQYASSAEEISKVTGMDLNIVRKAVDYVE